MEKADETEDIGVGDTVGAGAILIGNELLSGRTQDANLAYIAKSLAGYGIYLREARIIRDEEQAIIEAVNDYRHRFDYVFTTGGIGPTHDDITAASIARACSVSIRRDPRAEALLRDHYTKDQANEARMKMADIPVGATLIANPISVAPGFRLENIFVLAGVPRIMQAMLDGVIPSLRKGAIMHQRTVTANLLEGTMAQALNRIQDSYSEIEIGSYPFFRQGVLGSSLVLRGTDRALLDRAAGEVMEMARHLGSEPRLSEE